VNERIKELAEQAETKEIGYYFFDREKFAELIVRKCIEIDIENPDARPGVEIAKYFGIENAP
jgi:hypothetical protein